MLERVRSKNLLLDKSYELGIIARIVLAFGMASLTGVLAQIKLYIPWTPVPITGQTFTVLLSGIMLGKWGGISQIIYVALGIAGIPWFSGLKGGYQAFIGPTGGYLIGFILASIFIGYLLERYRLKNLVSIVSLMIFADFVLIYGPGLLQLWFWYHLVKGINLGFYELLLLGAIPFILGDLIKIFVSAGIGYMLYLRLWRVSGSETSDL